jgi:hypothetical protein
VTPHFPQECRFVLESLGEVYGNDETARAQCIGLRTAPPLPPGTQRTGDGEAAYLA